MDTVYAVKEKTVACHLDELNRETAWLLAHMGLQPRRSIKDVYLRVGDVMVTDAPTLHADQTLREGGLLMQRHGLGLAANAFSASPNASGLLVLPGVMSRKKQVVPPLAAALKESSAAT